MLNLTTHKQQQICSCYLQDLPQKCNLAFENGKQRDALEHLKKSKYSYSKLPKFAHLQMFEMQSVVLYP